MLKWLGFVLVALTTLWMVIQKDSFAWASVAAGACLSLALSTIFNLARAEKSISTTVNKNQKLAWQMKLEEAQSRTSQTIDGLNREVQRLEQKSIRSEERCHSYQKLVDVHQQEIEKLRYENHDLAQQLIQKERKLNQLHLARVEPDLFDAQLRQTESANRELKKQLSEKQQQLYETRSHLSQAKNEMTSDMTELLEKLKASEEERSKLESEMAALKQLMTRFSANKDPKKTIRKKKAIEVLESRDLLG